MVDQIGPKPAVAIDARTAPVTRVAAPRSTEPAVEGDVARADPSTLKALSKPLAAQPPVDAERVARIKKAIRDGEFPILPAEIADRLLALKLQWRPSEPA